MELAEFPLVPENNIASFAILFEIETVLRELIIAELTAASGPKWYKGRLPSDVLAKYRSAMSVERKRPWRTLIPHHPLYYVDFPDLRKIIDQSNNWRDVFGKVFRKREVFLGALEGLEPIRNAVAHNRSVSDAEYLQLQVVRNQVRDAAGSSFGRFLNQSRLTHADITARLRLFGESLETALQCATAVKPITDVDELRLITTAWWFDETYLEHKVESMIMAVDVLGKYSRLPRRRGDGYVVERWLDEHQVSQLSLSAREELASLLGSVT